MSNFVMVFKITVKGQIVSRCRHTHTQTHNILSYQIVHQGYCELKTCLHASHCIKFDCKVLLVFVKHSIQFRERIY